jgi:hypothetical protein
VSGELRSLDRNAQALKLLEPYIGDLPLQQVHAGTLEGYVRDRRKQGIKNGTLRHLAYFGHSPFPPSSTPPSALFPRTSNKKTGTGPAA